MREGKKWHLKIHYIQGDPASFRWAYWAEQPKWIMVGMDLVPQDYHTIVRWLAAKTIRNQGIFKKPK